jgi:signal peptidase II
MQAARGASLNPSDPAVRPGEPSAVRGARPSALLLLAAVAALGYAADLVTKVLAVEHLTGRAPVPVVGDLLTLHLVRNPGAAFSSGTSYTVVLTAVAVAAAAGVLWYSRRLRSTGWALALGFLLAGVLGNLTDRLFRAPGVFRGHVVDFLQLPHWPIFNVADMCINVAAGLIIVQALRGMSVDGTRSRRHTGPDGTEAT